MGPGHYEAGTLHETLGNLSSNFLSIFRLIGFENLAVVNDTWLRAYSSAFPDQESCLGAIEFPLDALLNRPREYVLAEIDRIPELSTKPAMMVEGMQDHGHNPEDAILLFRALYPDSPLTMLPNAGHYSQEDAPEIIVPLIRQFLTLTK